MAVNYEEAEVVSEPSLLRPIVTLLRCGGGRGSGEFLGKKSASEVKMRVGQTRWWHWPRPHRREQVVTTDAESSLTHRCAEKVSSYE